MKIPLPNLDDRRWADLVEEGRSLIPLYAPDWTDHNIHDPGITLLELFAWIAEMDIFQLNRVTDEHRLKFLRLVGLEPAPPRAARAIVACSLNDAEAPRRLRRGIEVAGNDVFGDETRFRLLHGIDVAPGRLRAVQSRDARGFQDLTEYFERREPFAAFGATEDGAELYIGLTKAPRRNRPLTLYFKFDDPRAGQDERERIIEEARALQQACRPVAETIDCIGRVAAPDETARENFTLPPFHGASLQWEFLVEEEGRLVWRGFGNASRRLRDETRAFTLDGRVVFRLPAKMAKAAIGRVALPLYWLRCRLKGALDAPPIIRAIAMNAVPAEQATAETMTLTIRSDAVIEGEAPPPGERIGLALELDGGSRITRLIFDDTISGPKFRVLGFTPPSINGGILTLDAVFVGTGQGRPYERFALRRAPVQQESLELFTFEQGAWHEWHLWSDLDAAKTDTRAFTFDAMTGAITFGDGRRGRVPAGALIFARHRSTRAMAGNLAAGAIDRLLDSPINRARMESFEEARRAIARVYNPLPAEGGRAAETLDQAAGRAIELMSERQRAVTLKDFEELAMRTPGARLARVSARAALHPGFSCFKAPGTILLIILPSLPAGRPMPSAGLRRAVAAYINRHRVVGTRVEVVGPTYLEVAVRARVRALAGADREAVRRRVIEALNAFFDPLSGGPDRTGWPFGRDVYRAEVMQVIDEVAGVDHVAALELQAGGCEAQCGNLCVGLTGLVAAGEQDIEVI